MPRARRVALGVVAALVCTATALITAAPAQASNPGGTISRSEVLSRAQSWVNEGVPYNQSGYWTDSNGTYREDCSGFVSMAWHLTSSMVTSTLPNVASVVGLSSLKPGDAVDFPAEHVFLFDAWVDQGTGDFTYYAESNVNDPTHGPTPANVNWSSLEGWPTTDYEGLTYNNVTGSTPGPAPGPLRQFIPNANGSWSAWNITANTSPAGVNISGKPFISSASGGVNVWARDPNGGLEQFIPNANGSWSAYNISAYAGGVTIAGNPVVTTSASGQANVWARDPNGGLEQFIPGAGGSWSAYNISALAGGVTIAGNPFVSSASGGINVWARDPNGGLEQFIPNANGSWSAYNISANAGGVTIAGDPFVSTIGGAVNVWAQDPNGGLEQFIPNANGSWSAYNISANAGGVTIAGSPVVTTSASGQANVWARDPNSGLEQFIPGAGGSWSAYNITAYANGVTIAGDPFVSTIGGTVNVWARDPNGGLEQFIPGAGGTWSAYNISANASGVTIAGDPVVTTSASGQVNVWAAGT